MHSATVEIVPTGLCLFRKQVLPGSRNSVMICKKPVTQKYGHRRVKPPVIETQAGISAEGCLCCSTKLITLLRQQGRSPAGGGGRRSKPGRVDVRLWGICFSLRHLTEKLTSGTTSWASAQSMEEPLGIHNVGWWLTVRVCVCGVSTDRTGQPLQEPIMITSDLQQHAHFTALSIKVSTALYVTRR